jgi:hypothetical protein
MHGQLRLREMVELRAGEHFYPKSLFLASCPNLVGPRRKWTSVPSYAMHGQLRLREMVELRAGEQFSQNLSFLSHVSISLDRVGSGL